MTKLKHIATGLLLLTSSLVFASSDADRLRPQWQSMDKNGDGKVAITELHPMMGPVMSRSDLNRDGFISLSEYVSYDLDPGGGGRMPLADNVKLISDIPYAGTDDPRQQLDIFLPKKASVDGPLPVIAYVHGGGWRVGSKVMARPQLMPLINSGRYAAVSIGYRLAWQDAWPAQIHDIKAAVRWVRAHAEEYGFDTSRICAMGASAGGHLVAAMGTTNGVAAVEGKLGEYTGQSSDVHCVIDFFGPADLSNAVVAEEGTGPSPIEMLLGGPVKDNREKAIQASPISHVDASDPPFLIVHGTKDPLVDYAESVKLDKALREAAVPVIFQTIEGGGHGNFGGAFAEVGRRVQAFLDHTFYDKSIKVPSEKLAITIDADN